MNNFAIVKFVDEDDAPGIISLQWLDCSKKWCHYPNTKVDGMRDRLLRTHAQPEKDWHFCQVAVLQEYGETFLLNDLTACPLSYVNWVNGMRILERIFVHHLSIRILISIPLDKFPFHLTFDMRIECDILDIGWILILVPSPYLSFNFDTGQK